MMSSNGTSPAAFVRQDETGGLVTHRVEMLQEAELEPGVPLVTQVSRWDPLKDHLGVMQAFARYMTDSPSSHLMLAGPAPSAVSDDPEGLQTFEELRAAWFALPDHTRSRVHIACLPMSDLEENAAVVNALQRRSDVVVQKSLAEGFGLTLAEAMWKRRPTVGSRVGGIQDQISDGSSGLLVDPMDHRGLARAVTSLLRNGGFAEALGAAAAERVLDEYLAPRHLIRYLGLIDWMLT
jgi:trehalose synthase